jgi:hypothetical protein
MGCSFVSLCVVLGMFDLRATTAIYYATGIKVLSHFGVRDFSVESPNTSRVI